MRNIRELFEKIYGFNPNTEQLELFIKTLKRRLTVRELEYVSCMYGVDLLGFDAVERRIRVVMRHPIIIKEIEAVKSEYDEVDEMFGKIKDNEYISISLIQRKFSIGFPSASSVIEEMLNRKMISFSNKKNKYLINKDYK